MSAIRQQQLSIRENEMDDMVIGHYVCNQCGETLTHNEVHIHRKIDKRFGKGEYWYLTVTEECVLCGRGGTQRIRKYSSKPINPKDRYEFHQFVCEDHY